MDSMKLGELKALAKERNVKGYSKMSKQSLLDALKPDQECEKGVCELPIDKPVDAEPVEKIDQQKDKRQPKNAKKTDEQSIDIDWDNVIKKASKLKLVTYGESIGAKVAAKMSKQDLLDEILYHVTKKVYTDLV